MSAVKERKPKINLPMAGTNSAFVMQKPEVTARPGPALAKEKPSPVTLNVVGNSETPKRRKIDLLPSSPSAEAPNLVEQPKRVGCEGGCAGCPMKAQCPILKVRDTFGGEGDPLKSAATGLQKTPETSGLEVRVSAFSSTSMSSEADKKVRIPLNLIANTPDANQGKGSEVAGSGNSKNFEPSNPSEKTGQSAKQKTVTAPVVPPAPAAIELKVIHQEKPSDPSKSRTPDAPPSAPQTTEAKKTGIKGVSALVPEPNLQSRPELHTTKDSVPEQSQAYLPYADELANRRARRQAELAAAASSARQEDSAKIKSPDPKKYDSPAEGRTVNSVKTKDSAPMIDEKNHTEQPVSADKDRTKGAVKVLHIAPSSSKEDQKVVKTMDILPQSIKRTPKPINEINLVDKEEENRSVNIDKNSKMNTKNNTHSGYEKIIDFVAEKQIRRPSVKRSQNLSAGPAILKEPAPTDEDNKQFESSSKAVSPSKPRVIRFATTPKPAIDSKANKTSNPDNEPVKPHRLRKTAPIPRVKMSNPRRITPRQNEAPIKVNPVRPIERGATDPLSAVKTKLRKILSTQPAPIGLAEAFIKVDKAPDGAQFLVNEKPARSESGNKKNKVQTIFFNPDLKQAVKKIITEVSPGSKNEIGKLSFPADKIKELKQVVKTTAQNLKDDVMIKEIKKPAKVFSAPVLLEAISVLKELIKKPVVDQAPVDAVTFGDENKKIPQIKPKKAEIKTPSIVIENKPRTTDAEKNKKSTPSETPLKSAAVKDDVFKLILEAVKNIDTKQTVSLKAPQLGDIVRIRNNKGESLQINEEELAQILSSLEESVSAPVSKVLRKIFVQFGQHNNCACTYCTQNLSTYNIISELSDAARRLRKLITGGMYHQDKAA